MFSEHPTAPGGAEQAANGTARHAVRVDEHPPVSDASLGEIEIPGPDFAHRDMRVGGIERPPIGAEGEPVRGDGPADPRRAPPPPALSVRIEPIWRAALAR